jgi:ubiquinone/menaquinone biosynthesis C-methylase UbiE
VAGSSLICFWQTEGISKLTQDAVDRQREYYTRTAAFYDEAHVARDNEHMRALAMFEGIARSSSHGSFLDIGAGTGRALHFLKTGFPQSRVVGIEPVDALRDVGHRKGLKQHELVKGDATRLPFADNEFDWVIETGVLHHIRDADLAVREMVRVAKTGILISDSNNMGQGSLIVRLAKRAIKAAGLWPSLIWVQTLGKGYKFSEGDGVYYSYCAFDSIDMVRVKFPVIFIMNTMPSGYNLYTTSPHVAIIAVRT